MNKEKYMEWINLLKELDIVLEKIRVRKNKKNIQDTVEVNIE